MSDYNLKRFGYAPGPYSIICSQCQEEKQDCDKRAHTCHECALSLHADELQSSLEDPQKVKFEYFCKMLGDNLAAHPSWRYGQALFNSLAEVYPALADEIRSTKADPFYYEKADHQRCKEFWRRVIEELG